MTVTKRQLVDAFSDCVGQEKAEAVIDDVLREFDLADRSQYSEEEAVEIIARIANREQMTPYVRTAASMLQTRIQTGNV